MAKVAILMGSKSDFPVVRPAAEALKKFGVETEVRVISAHRTPDEAHAFAENAEKNGVEVVICAAGKAAHLGGVIAAYTTLPVIGLPVKTDMMGGLDSLLSIVQMPSALLGVEILGVKYPDIARKLKEFKASMANKINADDKALQEELKNL